MNRRTFLAAGVCLALSGTSLGQPPPLPVTGSALTPEEASFLLHLHNLERSEVGVPPVTWSTEIARGAQHWADQLLTSGRMQHGNSNYGENLAMAGSVDEVFILWLEEKERFHPSRVDYLAAGHYTQIVWAKTRSIGCGKAGAIWVCRYDPRGNQQGEKPY